MEERKKFIEDWLAGGRRDLAGLSRAYGIRRQTEHKWVQRLMEGGLEGMADRSHTRRDRAGRVPAEIERRPAARAPDKGSEEAACVAHRDAAGHGLAGVVDDRQSLAAGGPDAAAQASVAVGPDGRGCAATTAARSPRLVPAASASWRHGG